MQQIGKQITIKDDIDGKTTYRTVDLYLATWMVANGLELIKVSFPANSTKAYFIFKRIENIETLVGSFYKQALIHQYISAMKNVKERLYAAERKIEEKY